MPPSYEEFGEALQFLVSIEPDPSEYSDMDEYDALQAPYEQAMQKAYDTIRAYGAHIAPQGLEHMQSVFYALLEQHSDPKAYAVIESMVSALWNGKGEWQA